MKAMVPFYYAVVALLFGMLGGFCIRCYHLKGDENFSFVLINSACDFVKISLIMLLLPVLVVFSNKFRRLLLYILINNAEKDYTVSISDTDKDNLINVLSEKISLLDFAKIAANLSWFCFVNLPVTVDVIIRQVSIRAEYKFSMQKIRSNFFRDVPFYKNSLFARNLFCL